MLYIEDGDEVKLPKKFHSINNLCAIIYDQLTEILTDENYISLKKTMIPFDKESQILISEFDNGEINPLDWLKENKLNDALATVLAKHISMSILSDFVNFIYESLSCARKGKMSVAYALIRKPLTDELLIFEQILNDKNEFVDRFFHDGLPSTYDPSERSLDKGQIIANAFEKIKAKFTLNKDIIYQLRYDKSCKAGINGISNQALHIVTKDSNYRTANQDLNFVFSNHDDLEKYFIHYYNFVPYLLIYSVAVIDELIFSLLPDNEQQKNLKAVKKLQETFRANIFIKRNFFD
ncbi:hypothetical protein [Rufibacter sp. LB8]|uniref:hypothetical protein n=1 Tax=Rufibacter sp. LB8 TaxID=2777781 RepID=UPI00178C1953|nr:hypothetical protein [Rufibacter sp. LB8]